MAHTRTWNAAYEADPADGDAASGGALDIRQVKQDIRERLDIDHYFDIAGTDADHGFHQKVTFQAPIASPTIANDQSALYKKTGDKVAELRLKGKNAVDSLIIIVGEVRMILGTTVPGGWLALNGDTIGSAASGADQADDDMEDLFTYLWTELADAQSPMLTSGGVESSRGVSAASDWTANKRLTMPDARGRMPVGVGQGTHKSLAFTSGGTYVIAVGDEIEGEIGGATATVVEVRISDGSFAGADCRGTLILKDQTGAFQAETIKVGANLDAASIGADSTAMTSRTVGDVQGGEVGHGGHTHGVGTFVVEDHLHQVYEHNAADDGDYFDAAGAQTGLAALSTVTGSTNNYLRGGVVGSDPAEANDSMPDMYTDKTQPSLTGESTYSGEGVQALMNPWLALSMVIKY